MSHEMTWETNGVYWKYIGLVTGNEIIKLSSAIYGDPRFDNLRYKLVDFLDVQSIEMDETQVIQIASQHKAASISNPNIKNAIVTKQKNNHLINTFVAFMDNSAWDIQVFDALEKANVWLGRNVAN